MLSICNRFDFSQVIIGVYQSTSNKGFKGEKLSLCCLSIPDVKKETSLERLIRQGSKNSSKN